MMIGAVATVLCRPDLGWKTVVGGLLFLMYYVVFLLGLEWTVPGYIAWVGNLDALSGLAPAGMPVKELFLPSHLGRIGWLSATTLPGKALLVLALAEIFESFSLSFRSYTEDFGWRLVTALSPIFGDFARCNAAGTLFACGSGGASQPGLRKSTTAVFFLAALFHFSMGEAVAASAPHPCDTFAKGAGRTIYVSMEGGERKYDGQIVTTVPFHAALAGMCSGDIIQLVADDYRLQGKAVSLRRNAEDRSQGPVVLRGLGADTTIIGGTDPGFRLSPKSMAPRPDEHACLQIEDQSQIVIENIDFRDCWPIAILAVNSRYITLRDSRLIGSTFGLYALGTCRTPGNDCGPYDPGMTAHHYLIENVEWIQDRPEGLLPPRGYEVSSGNMWRRYRWIDVHDRNRPYHYFNGALFGSRNILGGLVFRSNQVRNAFNGVRLDLPKHKVSGTRNLNIEIYGNRFDFVRDNSVEPEHEVTNLWVHGNRVTNAFASISTDGVGGKYWYIFGNIHRFNEVPGEECALDPSCRKCLEQPLCARDHMHRRGKMLKLGKGPFPAEAFYVFHNSVFQRHPIAAEGETRNLDFSNNAIQICSREGDLPGRCAPGPAFDGTCYRPNYRFEGNVSNDPGCMAVCGEPSAAPVCVFGEAVDTTAAPLFVDPLQGDLRLAPTSPARGAALAIRLRLPDGTTWSGGNGDTWKRPDAGAYQNGANFQGPPFVLFDPEDRLLAAAYGEKPRIVRVSGEEMPGGWVQSFVFSVPVFFDGPPDRLILRAQVEGRSPQSVLVSESCGIEGRTLRCRFVGPQESLLAESTRMVLPRGIKSRMRLGIRETASIEMTLWASVDPRVCLEPDLCPNLKTVP